MNLSPRLPRKGPPGFFMGACTEYSNGLCRILRFWAVYLQ